MRILFICLFYLCVGKVVAQNTESTTGGKEQDTPIEAVPDHRSYFLALEKGGRVKRIRFYTGDYLAFTFKHSRERQKAKITNITANRIEMFETAVELQNIQRITLHRQNKLASTASGILPAAGILYFLGDMLNPLLSGKDGFRIRQGSIITPAVLIGSGGLLYIFRKRTIKLNQKRYLKIIEIF